MGVVVDGVPMEIVVGKPFNVKFVMKFDEYEDVADVEYNYVSFDNSVNFEFEGEGIAKYDDVINWVNEIIETQVVKVVINGDVVVYKDVEGGGVGIGC